MYDKKFRRKGKFLFILLFPLMWLLIGAVVMGLWNAILPSLLNVNHITYWQSVGLLLLCRILFGGFHFRKRGDGPPRFGGGKWAEMREKWMNMTPEDRMNFKSKMRDKWCGTPKPDDKREP